MRTFMQKAKPTPQAVSAKATIPARVQDSTITGNPRLGHDFSQIPIYASEPIGIQPKLTVSTPGDLYEQEADHVADRVVQGPDHGTPRAAVQRSEAPGAADRWLTPEIGAGIQAMRGGGRPL